MDFWKRVFLEARISGLLQWQSQAEAAGLQAERSARDSLTQIAKGMKQSLQSIEDSNNAVVKGFMDSTKIVGGLAGRLGLESLYLLVFPWFLNKVWHWCSSYLANFAAIRPGLWESYSWHCQL